MPERSATFGCLELTSEIRSSFHGMKASLTVHCPEARRTVRWTEISCNLRDVVLDKSTVVDGTT